MPDEHAETTAHEEGGSALQAAKSRLLEAQNSLGLLAPGAALTPAAAAIFCDLQDEAEAAALLRALLAQGLLEVAAVQSPDGGDMLAYRLPPGPQPMAPAAAHRALLERYRLRTRKGAWHTLPDDGTIHACLAWHMEQAGLHDELQALLAEETTEGRSAWHEVRECLGQIPGYVQDLERAWQRAGQEFAAGGPDAGFALGLQCRYSLLASSVRSLEHVIPPPLLCALVRHGHWSPVQGLVAAGRLPDPTLRGEALICLSAAPEMPANMASGLIQEALAIDNVAERARVLLGVARHLPEECMGLALDCIRHLPGEGTRARILVEMAPHLPPQAVEQALTAALALTDPAWRVGAVTSLLALVAQAGEAAHLPPELLPQTLSVIVEIEDEPKRATALGHLAPHLPEALCRQALACTWRMRDAAARSEAQVSLAAYLPAYWREKALTAALESLSQMHHARATLLLASMAPHLPAGLQEQAVALAEAQPDSHLRVGALITLLPHLYPQYRELAAGLALRSTLLIRSDAGRGDAIARLAPHLSDGLLDKALALAHSLADGRARAAALAAMAPFLDRRLSGTALAAAETIPDERSCAMALGSIAPLLDPEQQRRALLRESTLRDEKARAVALVGLAAVLPPALLAGVLAQVQQIADARALALALAGIAPAFDEAGRARILAITADIVEPQVRLDALLGLLPCLSEHQRAEALEAGWQAVQALTEEQAWVQALARLLAVGAPWATSPVMGHEGQQHNFVGWQRLSEDGPNGSTLPIATGSRRAGSATQAQRSHILQEALAGLTAIQDPDRRCQALLALAPHLPAPLWEDALAALPLDTTTPLAGLLALIPYLPGPLRVGVSDRCLAGVRRLPAPARSHILSGLLPYLDRRQLAEALSVARAIGDDEEQVRALLALAPARPKDERGEMLRGAGRVGDAGKASAILAARPAPVAQGQRAPHLPDSSSEGLLSTCRAGDRCAEALALTSLARLATDEEREAMLGKATEAARDIEDACCKAHTLAHIAPNLPVEVRSDVAGEVLRAVWACPAGLGARLLGQALVEIAPFLPADQVPAAIVEARRLFVPRTWSRWPEQSPLTALFRRLPEETLRSELAAAGRIHDLHLRAQTLSALAVALGELGHGQEAVSAIRPIEPLPYQVDALLHLASHLSLPWLKEALDMARDLGRHGAPAAARIAVRLAELGQVKEGWAAASEIPRHAWQAEAMAALAPFLPATCRAAAHMGALDAARRVRDPGERLEVLARMAPQLPRAAKIAALREALGTAIELKETAAAASPHPPRWRRPTTPLTALAAPLAALAHGNESASASALREIWLAGGQGERLLRLLAHQHRSITLLDLATLAPLLACLAGPAGTREIVAAVHQVARWWP